MFILTGQERREIQAASQCPGQHTPRVCQNRRGQERSQNGFPVLPAVGRGGAPTQATTTGRDNFTGKSRRGTVRVEKRRSRLQHTSTRKRSVE